MYNIDPDTISKHEQERLDFYTVIENEKKLKEIKEIIKIIPSKERTILLLTLAAKTQDSISNHLKISQELVSYLKKRAITRIKCIYQIRQITATTSFKIFLSKNLNKKQEKTLLQYIKTQDIKKLAKKQKISYFSMWSRVNTIIKKIKSIAEKEESKECQSCIAIFDIFKKHNSLYASQKRQKLQ
jgi:hypothetical protein